MPRHKKIIAIADGQNAVAVVVLHVGWRIYAQRPFQLVGRHSLVGYERITGRCVEKEQMYLAQGLLMLLRRHATRQRYISIHFIFQFQDSGSLLDVSQRIVRASLHYYRCCNQAEYVA